jgi:hypothetical protein
MAQGRLAWAEVRLDSILEPLTKSMVRLVQIRGEAQVRPELSRFRAGSEDMVGGFIYSLVPRTIGILSNVPSVEKGLSS